MWNNEASTEGLEDSLVRDDAEVVAAAAGTPWQAQGARPRTAAHPAIVRIIIDIFRDEDMVLQVYRSREFRDEGELAEAVARFQEEHAQQSAETELPYSVQVGDTSSSGPSSLESDSAEVLQPQAAAAPVTEYAGVQINNDAVQRTSVSVAMQESGDHDSSNSRSRSTVQDLNRLQYRRLEETIRVLEQRLAAQGAGDDNDNHTLRAQLAEATAEVASLREQITAEQLRRRCCVCWDREGDRVIVHCGHMVCGYCALQVSTSRSGCPVCRSPITNITRTYYNT